MLYDLHSQSSGKTNLRNILVVKLSPEALITAYYKALIKQVIDNYLMVLPRYFKPG